MPQKWLNLAEHSLERITCPVGIAYIHQGIQVNKRKSLIPE